MKKYSLFALFLALAATMTLTSCMDDNKNDMKVYQQLQSYFNVYTPVGGGAQQMTTPVSYSVTYNYSKATAELTITGLRLPGGTAYPSLSFKDLKFTEDGVWRRISAAIPELSGSGFNVALSNLKLNVADRQVASIYSPATEISFTAGEWYVNSFPTLYLTSGSPSVISPDGSKYEPEGDDAPYSLSFNPTTETCTISIQGMKFAPNMPAQNMRFKDLPFTATGNTIVVAKKDAFTPYILGGNDVETPFTRGSVSNLRAAYSSADGVQFGFDFTMAGMTYHVVINSLYNKE